MTLIFVRTKGIMLTAAKGLILSAFKAGIRTISLLLVLCMVLFLVVLGLAHLEHADRYPVFNLLTNTEKAIESPVVTFLHDNLPTRYEGGDMAPWIYFVGVFVLWVISEVLKSRLTYYGELLEQEKKVRVKNKALAAERKERLKAQKEAIKRLEKEASARADLAAKEQAQAASAQAAQRKAYEEAQRAVEAKKKAEPFKKISSPNDGHSREELLELMAQAKKQLEATKKNLSFLAIDVVDSTGMKIGEDPAICERDFRQYKKVVEKAIADNKGLKAAWTPDGVMICFPSAESAVAAAKQVINDLDHFNKHIKAMRRDFKVRCGVNAGVVLFDATVPMEEMSDRSIDIAGHMQKYAGENAIFVGKHVIEEMRTAEDFAPVSREVDGCEVYEWKSLTV